MTLRHSARAWGWHPLAVATASAMPANCTYSASGARLSSARFLAGFLLDHFNAGPRILGLPGGYPVIFGIFVVWLSLGTLLVLKVQERR